VWKATLKQKGRRMGNRQYVELKKKQGKARYSHPL
jgi:hypothetical protein